MNIWMQNIVNEKKKILDDLFITGYMEKVEKAALLLSSTLMSGNKILLAGNGGSAADAQHFAGEIVGRFLKEREAFPAISLCVDPSVLTCIGNDFGYKDIFARQVHGLGQKGDAFIGITTSGNSENIIYAAEEAHKKNMKVLCLSGRNGGALKNIAVLSMLVPSDRTPRIQEIHTFTIHLLCEMIENELYI